MPGNPESPNPLNLANPRAAEQIRMRALQQRAADAGWLLRAPPPLPTSCCGRGCSGCVWESYFNALDDWCKEAASTVLLI